MEDAIGRRKWCDAAVSFHDHEVNPATSINGDQTELKKVDLSLLLSCKY